MIRKIALLVILAAFALFLSGCVSPEYQFCCHKEEALGDSPVCYGMNESGEYETLDVVECSEEDWMCTLTEKITEGKDKGKNKVVPICPNVETTPCNTTCSGIFCGNFFYDPRPLAAGYGNKESHAEEEDEDSDSGKAVLEEPAGLWHAQCVLQNMTPLFLRQIENSDSIVMNKFRFGVGDTFQEFEEAQYYFPLTDRACFLNPSGEVDRYIVYAIPNQLKSGGKLCEQKNPVDGGTVCSGSCPYVCNPNSEIYSYSYFDCASRCALWEYGYSPEIEPFNPYLTEYNGEKIGNPFAYGPDRNSAGQDPYPSTASGSKIEFLEYYRNSVGPLKSKYYDSYPYGTTLYGATFGVNRINKDPEEYTLLEYLGRKERVGREVVPLLENAQASAVGNDELLSFNWDFRYMDSTRLAKTVFLTQENDPHELYPWLLAHHSVYNEQFSIGHIKYDGSAMEGGAEFECTTGMECLSGYCNNFDYKRGVCVGIDGKDVLCDCSSEGGHVVCLGTKGVQVASWDDPNKKVEVPVTLAATVDIYSKGSKDETLAALPALGAIKVITTKKGEEEIFAPFFVMDLGGGYYDPTDKAKKPDYRVKEWDDVKSSSDEDLENILYRMGYLLDPCSVFPSGTFKEWAYTDEDKRYVYCCDGTTTCEKANDTNIVRSYTAAFGAAGKLATRFLQNCLVGNAEDGHPYRADAYICYGQDAPTPLWQWGGFWGGSPLVNDTIAKSWGDRPFCRVLMDATGDMRPELGEPEQEDMDCYLYESGSHTKMGPEDDCVMESDSMLVIAPTWHKDIGRWSIGRCLINQNGDDLEIKEYGVCESCGYLTMAKQEITALPLEPSQSLDSNAFENGDMPDGNFYCPDMVVHTPHNSYSLKESSGTASPFGNYALEPYGMNGYVRYEFGNNDWDNFWFAKRPPSFDLETCAYPNGYTVFTDAKLDHNLDSNLEGDEGDHLDKRGLPYTYPNAFYINSELESMMKRNVQPVIFATDPNLWVSTILNEPTNPFLAEFEVSRDGEQYSTFELFKELYATRSYLFDAAKAEGFYYEDENAYAAQGSFLGNTIINEGAAILVMENYAPVDETDASFSRGRVVSRGQSARFLCPNCMLAVGIGYPASGGGGTSAPTGGVIKGRLMALHFDVDYDLKDIDSLFSDTSTGTQYVGSYIDAIALKLELKDGDDYCKLSGEERYGAILANLTYLGRETLIRHGKPILITDFTIDRAGSCWTANTAGEFMEYLGVHSKDLVKSGYIGLIYGQWDQYPSAYAGIRETGDGTRNAFFAGASTAARKFAGHSLVTYYSEVPTKDECVCVPCTSVDKPALCNGQFKGDSMGTCDGYQAGDYAKWPDNCIRWDVCNLPIGAEPYELSAAGGTGGTQLSAGEKEGPPTGESAAALYLVNAPAQDERVVQLKIIEGSIDISTSVGGGASAGKISSEVSEGVGVAAPLSSGPFFIKVPPIINCKVEYDNGTTEIVPFETEKVIATPSAYRDVLSSLDDKTWCFPLGENWVAYQKSEHHSFTSLPAVFAMDGNPDVECNPASGLADSFCGYYPPIANYHMECRFSELLVEDNTVPTTSEQVGQPALPSGPLMPSG